MPDADTALFNQDGKVVNPWQVLPVDFSGELPSGRLLLPLKVWLTKESQLPDTQDIGVWLNSDEDVELIGDKANQFPVIAINFPSFMDGRGFSLGRLLRERFGFKGELRAIGNVIRDQLFFLKRCGFDCFELPTVIQADEVSHSLQDFSITYQSAVDYPDPLFKRENL